MKKLLFITFFSCLSFLGIAQSILNKKIDFNADNLPLKEAIFKLSTEINTSFTFGNKILPNKKITAHFQQEDLETILTFFFANTNIDFKVESDNIILSKKEKLEFFTISGYLKDGTTGERLHSAYIIVANRQKGTTTNEYGFYSITLPKGEVNLDFSYLGYKGKSKRINLKRKTKLNISLKPSATFDEVIVTSKGLGIDAFTLSNNATNISIQAIKQLPTLGGEEDVLRTMYLEPGVQTGADGFGGFHVRGGSTDQNLILLDGVPVYNATHLGGIFSIFNSNAIKSAQLYKGNFPARFSGRLSSVLDIRTKEGNQRQLAGSLTLGLTSIKAALEGPIAKNKSSFFISLRRSTFGTYLKPISRKLKEKKGDKGLTNHGFLDFNGKMNFSLGKKDQIFLSLYHGSDNFKDENKSTIDGFDFRTIQHNQDLDWGNTIGALRWNHLFSDRLFANTTLTFSKFWFKSEEYYKENIITSAQSESEQIQENLFYNLYNSSIEDKAAKIDFDFIPSPNHSIKFGASAINHTFRPGAFTLDHNSVLGVDDLYNADSLIAVNNTINSQEYGVYLEDNITFSSKLKGNIGVHSTLINVQKTQYFSFQPRISLSYELDGSTYLKGSVGKMMQNLHLLTTSGIGLPTDLWVPATSKVKPQEAWQGTLGLERKLNEDFNVEIEAYYKQMNNLITYQEGSSFLVESLVLDASNWENKVTSGKGKSYGLEISIKKTTGKLKGWANYTLSRAKRVFEDINFGEAYNFRFDRPHSFKIAGTYHLNKKITFSANWSYETGIATTLPTGEYTFYSSNLFSPVSVLNIGAKNSFRLPNNHHLDVGVNFNFGNRRVQQILKFGVYNLYNRKNPLYYRLRDKSRGSGEKEFVQVTLLPITPSLSYSLQF